MTERNQNKNIKEKYDYAENLSEKSLLKYRWIDEKNWPDDLKNNNEIVVMKQK